MYKKRFFLLIVSVFFFIILVESGIRFILYLKSDTLFKTENHQILYKKYSERLNHLRYMVPRPKNPDEYLLNELNGFDKNLNTILIQGDSRTNQLNIKSVLKEIVNKSKFKKNIIFHNFNNEHVLRYLEEKKNKKFLCIFVPGDEASHLCDVYQYKVIVPSILRRLNQ